MVRSIAFALGLSSHAIAADGTWTSLNGGNWSEPANWSTSTVADGSGSTAYFNTLNPTSDVTVHLNGDRALSNLVFGDTNTTTAASWLIDNNGSPANHLILAGTTPIITVNALGTGKTTTISAEIQGSAGLVKAGAGTLVLAGNNTFTGNTVVSSGTLRLGSDGALIDAVTLTGGGILDLAGFSPAANVPLGLNSSASAFDVGAIYNTGTSTAVCSGPVSLGANTSVGAGNITFTGTITGNGKNLKKDGVNTLRLSNNGVVSLSSLLANRGGIQVDGGTHLNVTGINVGSGNSVGASLTMNGGSVSSTGTAQFGTGSGSASGTLNLNSGTLTVPGITKGAVTFNLNFNGGTLKAGAANAAFLSSASSANVLAGGALIDDGGFAITISKGLASGAAADGGLVKSGTGTITLTSANTFNGPTSILAGTLAIGSAAALAPVSEVRISAGARLDLSAVANHAWSQTSTLTATGGTALPAEIRGGSTIDLGSIPVVLNINPVSFNGDSSHPALVVSQGTLNLSGPVTVTNNSTSPLSDGVYVLIRQTTGNLSGTPTLSGPIGGQGIAAGRVVFLRLNGGDLELVVDSVHPTTTTIQRHAGTGVSSIYGDLLQFDVIVTPPTAAGTVEIRNGGTLLGSVAMTGGYCTIAIPETALAVGSHPNLIAVYQGNLNHQPGTSVPLAPAQLVTPKSLNIINATALDKYYDGTTTASISGTLAGVEDGDSVTLNPAGIFASANPGTNIAVTSTSILTGPSAAQYGITQPAGLTADIIAANIWTGGAGNSGTNLATGANYSPTATPSNPYNAIFNGSDPVTSDLTLATPIGGAVGTSGMVFGFTGNQGNPVTVTGSSGASARIASIIVSPGAGSVTFQGNLPFILGGPSADTSHSFINNSANALLFLNSGNWIPGGSGTYLRSMLFGGSGNITVAPGIVPSVPSRVSLSKSGSGTLTLSGSNTFSGGTTIQEGKIIATTATALGAGTVVNNGTLDLTAGAVTYTGLSSSLSGLGTVNVTLGTGSATTPLNGNYSNFTGTWNLGIGAVAGAGKVQMNGPDHPSATIHVLENATLYTTAGTHAASLVLHGGNTGESLGQLRIEGSAIWTGDVTLAEAITGPGDGHLGANSGTGTISGNIGEIGGPQGLVKDGDGTTVLTGTNTYTGPTSVNDGTLLVNAPGSLAAASSVTVNSGGTLGGSGLINGPVVVFAGGTLCPAVSTPVTLAVNQSITLAGTALFRVDRSIHPNCGRVSSSSNISYGGTLKVVNEGPALKPGDKLQLFTAPSFSGGFSSILLPPLGYDLMWDTGDLTVDGSISVVSAVSQDHPVISLSPGTFYQQILGIGGNFCQGEQNTLVSYQRYDEMFGPDGLNMSFIRLSTAHELAEPGFASFDANNVTTIQQFRARQPYGRVMLTTWTPPESLKSTNSPYQGTLAKTAGGQYRYAEYGAWWTRALQFYQNNSVLPDYVSIQNECDFTPTPPASGSIPAYMAGCYLNSTETSTKAGYPQALAAVRSAFSATGLGSMKMIGPDTTAIAGDKVKNYMDNIPSGQIDAIAHHLYHDSPGSTGIADLSRLQSLYPNWEIPKFMTELNPHDTYEDWDPAQPGWMQLAVTMHNVFTHERASTYMVWSSMYGFIDRFTGLPNNANYYALAHFSRFVNANNWRVAASCNDPDIAVTHYRHYYGPGIRDRQIVVLINRSAETKHATIGTAASWATDPAARFWQVFRTANDGSESPRVEMVEIEQGPSLSGDRQLVLPPYSLTTVRINTNPASNSYTNQQTWRFTHFGTMDNTGIAADDADADHDGESNLYEFATGQDPLAGTLVAPAMELSGENLEFTYTRSKSAVLDGVTFTVEWSDTLAAGTWSSAGISNQNPAPIAGDAANETLRVVVPAGIWKRFVRLRILAP